MPIYSYQCEINKFNIEKQFEKLCCLLNRHTHNDDIVIFPQLCLTGLDYQVLKDKYLIEEIESYNQKLIESTQDQTLIFSSLCQKDQEIKIVAYVASQGSCLFETYQQKLEYSYKKHFLKGTTDFKFETISIQDMTFGIVFDREIELVDQEVDVLVHLDFRSFIENETPNLKCSLAKKVISLNPISLVSYDKSNYFIEGHSAIDQEVVLGVEEGWLLSKQNPATFLERMLKFIQLIDLELFGQRFKWVIGLSGGLDSSVVASLITLALGKDRIVGLNMATNYNSSTTKNNANHLAQALGIEIRNGSIKPLVDSTLETLSEYHYHNVSEFNQENIQARIRGHFLSSVASIENGLVTNNTNKIEGYLGYGTLYGDTIGALGFLSDCTKLQVGKLAKQVNEKMNQEIVPENLIPVVELDGIHFGFKPSAELKQSQSDPMKWGYHDWLIPYLLEDEDNYERLLQLYQSKKFFEISEIKPFIKQYELDKPNVFMDDLNWVTRQFHIAMFKRVQGQPGLIISKTPFALNMQWQGVRLKSQKIQTIEKEIIG